jgi:predicted Zn finger-like uncharacterized protein
MVVTCPNCGSRYAVDPLAIGPAGRTVQCARCDQRWFQSVEGARPTPDMVIRPVTAGASLPAVIPPKPPFGWKRLVAVAVMLVVLLAAAMFVFREKIAAIISYEARASTAALVAAAPSPAPPTAPAKAEPPTPARPSAPPSAAAPAPPSPPSVVRTNATATGPRAVRPAIAEAARPQIEVDFTSSRIEVVNGRYIVRGQVVNNGKAAGSTTLLRLTFKRNDDVLGERSFPLVEGPLPPGGRASFSQALDDPPAGTTDIVPLVE